MKKLSQLIKEIEEDKNKPAKPNGIPSGFKDLDRQTGGFKNGQLTILGARPAMGTTTLALNFARNATRLTNKGVLLFSLDNSAKSLTKSIVKAHNGSGPANDLKIYIDDTHNISIQMIMEIAAKIKHESNIGFIIIDYLQLITGFEFSLQTDKKNGFLLLVRLLKTLAKCLNIPILLLSKLSRDVEIRGGDKRPMLCDISEYGNVENYVDVVLFFYRYGYYGITEDLEGNNIENRSEILIPKNRHKKSGVIYLQHDFEKAIFEETDYKPW